MNDTPYGMNPVGGHMSEGFCVNCNKQKQLVFFPKNDQPPSEELRHGYLQPSNPLSPYYGFIGNRKAVNKLIRIDFSALGKYNHLCRDLALAFVGGAGCGKTELARRHAKANCLPFVELSPRSLKTTHDIFEEIQRVTAAHQVPLVERGQDNYICPPINVFIDEVHALTPSIVNGLLKATEYQDSILVTEQGAVLNTYNIHWMIATTDRGKLFDAFDTRFIKVNVNYYTKADLAKIISVHHPEFDLDTCHVIANYCSKVPREALAFAREMELEYNMNPRDWQDVAAKIAEDNDIDRYGMTYQRLAILKALAQGPVSHKRLPIAASVKVEELEKFILPWLLETTEDQPALVTVSSRGYILTDAGISELAKRNISYDKENMNEKPARSNMLLGI